jgi:hypothetical protein
MGRNFLAIEPHAVLHAVDIHSVVIAEDLIGAAHSLL